MKTAKALLATLVLFIAALAFAAEDKPATAAKPALETAVQKASYVIGIDLGRNFKAQGIEVDMNLLWQGIRDGMAGGETLLTEAEMRETMAVFQREMMARREERMKTLSAKNEADAGKFFAENKGKPGVETLASGLQYRVLKAGAGKTPKPTDTVTVHYRGTLLDGTEFDSSYRRGAPAAFPVKGVIKGWTEALELMKEGSKWQIFIPANLAYGPQGRPPVIGPNAALIFEVEIISIGDPERGTGG